MGSLDAHQDEILMQLLGGDWEDLLPKNIFSSVKQWFSSIKDTALVSVRFTFPGVSPKHAKYAMYLICEPKVVKGKVKVKDMKYVDEKPLAMPPSLYEFPLYCMPSNLYDILIKKSKN